jgi:hypothetical protein
MQTAAAARNDLIDHKEVYKALGAGKDASFSGVLKLRGIPFTTTKAQVFMYILHALTYELILSTVL